MSNLTLTAQWHDAINQVETTEKILGGANGNANLATKQLAENILWLKKKLESIPNEAIKVGDTYITTLDHANAAAVATHHGYGTWERCAEGRALVGLSKKSDDIAEYKTIGTEFGENTHTLTIDEMPAHKHSKGDLYNKFMAKGQDVMSSSDSTNYISSDSTGLTGVNFDNAKAANEHQTGGMTAKGWTDSTEQAIGGGQSHNNIPPSVVVAIWRRTA